jgi:hypothetical protein
MPTLLREARPTARREHRCSCCGGSIDMGVAYCRETYVYDGHVYDWKVCAPCGPVTHLVWDWAGPYQDEGIGLDDYVEWALEHRTAPKHGPAARALLARAGRPAEGGGS